MTISSSLNAGVAGLNANASKLATISDNIANSSTYGYKRAETDFHSVVTSSGSSSTYSAGGVRTTSLRLIDERGPLIGTSSATDIAVNGSGFIPVTTISAVDSSSGSYPVTLATTGSFYPDEDGILRTATGEVLLGWPAAADGSIGSYPRDSLSALKPVNVTANQYAANPTTTASISANLPATWTAAGASNDPIEIPVEYFDNLGNSQTMTVTFTPDVPASGSSNAWTMTVTDGVSGSVVGEYTLTFDATQGSGGTLASVATVSGGAYDATTGTMDIGVAGGTIALTIGKPGSNSGLTQLSDSYYPGTVTKNGSAVGSLVSVAFDESGKLYATYDQGFSRCIWQVPVVDVANTNGLIALDNQTYRMTPASGSFYLWDAGTGPTGTISGYSREESSTDVATELTQLIQTQRAYSSNAKVIQTVDEMLQETTNLKR
ncbi:MAG: flagellar hook-basal body complex protein [Paracoccaceae bacterium]